MGRGGCSQVKRARQEQQERTERRENKEGRERNERVRKEGRKEGRNRRSPVLVEGMALWWKTSFFVEEMVLKRAEDQMPGKVGVIKRGHGDEEVRTTNSNKHHLFTTLNKKTKMPVWEGWE